MKKLSEIFSLRERCWPGYKPTPGKKAYDKGSCVKEASAAAIAAATAISKKKSGNYDKKGFRKTPYKNPDHPNVKSNEQRRKEINEDFSGDNPQQVAGSAQSTLTDKPNKEPMKTYKKTITELSTELLARYKDKASAAATKADKEGNYKLGDKRFSGIVKATNKQFDNFKKKGFKEETEDTDIHWSKSGKEATHNETGKKTYEYREYKGGKQTGRREYRDAAGKPMGEAVQIDEISSDLVAKARDVAFTKGNEKQAFRFVRKHYEKQKKESDALGKKMAEEVEQIDEISAQAHKEYQAKARSDVKALAKHTGGEYGDIAKNIMNRRMKGLSTSTALQHRDTMAKVKKVNEAIKDKFDIGEYDQEGDMAKSDLRSIMANAKKLHDMIEDADNLPEWCQNKITLAEDYISTVANYLTAEMNEETEIQEDEKKVNLNFKSLAPKDDHHTYYKFITGKAKMGKPLSQKEKQFASSYRLMKQEEVEQIDEKNVPTSPEKWAQAKAQAKAKFDVYPSAYANGWAAKKYKAMGGGWKSVSEEVEITEEGDRGTNKSRSDAKYAMASKRVASRNMKTDDLPFTPDKPKKQSVIAGKYGAGYSTARHLARSAMQKQVEKLKKQPIKEESRKAAIVKNIMKKKKTASEDAFQKDPELSSTLTKI